MSCFFLPPPEVIMHTHPAGLQRLGYGVALLGGDRRSETEARRGGRAAPAMISMQREHDGSDAPRPDLGLGMFLRRTFRRSQGARRRRLP